MVYSQGMRFLLADCSLKEMRKRNFSPGEYYIVDISKIIKELGYDINDISKESEFVINYSVQKKITQGIYSKKSDSILIINKEISESFIENLKHFLEDIEELGDYEIETI